MGFTGKRALEWKIKYILAFNEMEKKLKQTKAIQTSDTPPMTEAPATEKSCTFLGMPVYTSGQVARMFELPTGNVVHICPSAAAKMSREKDYTVLKGNALRKFKAQNPNAVVVSVRWLCVVFETGVAKIKKYLHSLVPAAKPERLPVVRQAPAKTLPPQVKPQRLCVDVPENREIQKKIAALRKTITALSALVDTYDAYHLPEEAKGLATAIQQVSCRVSLDAFHLTKLPGNLIPV